MRVEVPGKRYPGAAAEAVAAFPLELRDGEFLCLVGPSGCGKTTLLNMLGGVDGPPLLPLRVGYVFQEPRLLPWRTVIENVRLVLGRDDAPRAEEFLSVVGLQDALRLYPNQLSGGMQRRVAIARAFAPRPEALLMDEPFVSLDRPTAQRLRAFLLELWRRERPRVVFVTHDPAEAVQLADRILFLSRGPARPILDHEVPLPRDRRDEAAVARHVQALLARHPRLLSGEIDGEEAGRGTVVSVICGGR